MCDGTKKRILDETLRVIGEVGLSGFTVRGVAERAGVNVAAINYHFGSKDSLIGSVLDTFAADVQAGMEFLDSTAMVPEDKLEKFILTYMENLMRYPGLIRSLFIAIISRRELLPQLRAVVFGLMGRIIPVVSEIIGSDDETTCKMVLMQVISRILFPVVAGDVMKEVLQVDIKDDNSRYRYVDLMMHSIESLLGRI